jgi:hypothetical protein
MVIHRSKFRGIVLGIIGCFFHGSESVYDSSNGINVMVAMMAVVLVWLQL